MKQLVYITEAKQTPFITNDGFQKVLIKLKSNCPSIELWGRISLERRSPHMAWVEQKSRNLCP